MKTRLLSVLLVFLLLASVSIPAVSAIPVANANPAVCLAPLIPPVANVIIGSVTVVMTGAAALEIAKFLGKTWDNTQEGWNKLMNETGNALADLMHNKNKWVDATSSKAKAVLEFDYYTAVSGSGDKKNDTLYHKAERDKKTKTVRINTKRISEDDAVKELKAGRDIFTAKKELAEKLVDRVSEENHAALKLDGKPKKCRDEEIENHGNGKDGYYDHYHPKYQNTHPHCWWKEP